MEEKKVHPAELLNKSITNLNSKITDRISSDDINKTQSLTPANEREQGTEIESLESDSCTSESF